MNRQRANKQQPLWDFYYCGLWTNITTTCIHPVHGMIKLCNRIRMCRKYQQDMSAMFIIISLIHYWHIHFHIFINSLKPTEITTKTTTLHSTHTLNYTLIHDMHKQITILPHWKLQYNLKLWPEEEDFR